MVSPLFERIDPNAELRRVWSGKYPLPRGTSQLQFTPFKCKPGGGFVGALYHKTPTKAERVAAFAKTWLGKPGFAYRGFEKSSEIDKTRSITRRGLDAIAEKIAGDAYTAANTGRYFIPKHRLAMLPVRHNFLREDHLNLVDFALAEINKDRPVPITETIHVLSKWIDDFQDLGSIRTRQYHSSEPSLRLMRGAAIPFMESITEHQHLPETVFIDGQDVPLMGLIDILAVSRLLADSDVLGGKGDNAGILVYRDAQGHPIVAKAVKIDPGFAFNFRGHENRFQRTRLYQLAAFAKGEAFVPEADMLRNLQDIQFGNNHPVNIQWTSLSAQQQCDFLLALNRGSLALGEGTMIEMLLLRGGAFKLHGEDLVREATATNLAKQWRDNIKQQQKCYKAECQRHREGLAQRQKAQEQAWQEFASRLNPNAPAARAMAQEKPAPDEIPGFICYITQEVMKDPVMTPSGRSFERSAIEDWVRKSGTDPLTRKPLRLDQLTPNRALKEAIEQWLQGQASAAARPSPIHAPKAPMPLPARVIPSAPMEALAQAQPALPAIAFGAKQWRQFFGDVGVEPPLPPDIDKILKSPCPFWPHKRVEETHVLTLIPARVNGQPFCLDLLGDLLQHPKTGHKTQYGYYGDAVKAQIGQESPGRSYWILMSRDVLDGTREKTYKDQCVFLNQKRGSLPYEPPGMLEAATAILMEHVQSGAYLFGREPLTFTRCKERIDSVSVGSNQLGVGGFDPSGVLVSYYYGYFYCCPDYADKRVGVGGLRKF